MARRRVAIYTRVSTDDQTLANQQRELESVAKRHGWQIVARFQDHGLSGAEKRPGYDKLLAAVARRDVDMIAAWSVDRLGRSMQQLISLLEELKAKQVDLYIHRQAVDTTTPAGRALFQMCGVFAEFERAMTVERIKAGMARAKATGQHVGRPRIGKDRECWIAWHLARGLSVAKTTNIMGLGSSTVQRVRAEAEASGLLNRLREVLKVKQDYRRTQLMWDVFREYAPGVKFRQKG